MQHGNVGHEWNAYVALGDSFTEGLNDPGANGAYQGWADRLAHRLAALRPGFRYANLAVRGKLLREIVEQQLPQAVRLRPDLVTFAGGGNDILRPGADPDVLAELYEQGVARLRAAGCRVVVFTGFDVRDVPVLRRVRGKIGTYNAHLRTVADRHDCPVVDLWEMTVLRDPRAWSADRLHLAPEGHRRVMLRASEVLGVATDEDWNAPWPPASPTHWATLRGEDLRWARDYLVPWLGRRLRGQSSGRNVEPKRPDLLPLPEAVPPM
jgi:lysophospholipase L1-like esterase